MDIKGIDLVASLCVGVCGALIYCGHDGAVVSLFATVIGYYFGKQAQKNGETAKTS